MLFDSDSNYELKSKAPKLSCKTCAPKTCHMINFSEIRQDSAPFNCSSPKPHYNTIGEGSCLLEPLFEKKLSSQISRQRNFGTEKIRLSTKPKQPCPTPPQQPPTNPQKEPHPALASAPPPPSKTPSPTMPMQRPHWPFPPLTISLTMTPKKRLIRPLPGGILPCIGRMDRSICVGVCIRGEVAWGGMQKISGEISYCCG
jgi:hypothetical protein